MKNHLARKMSVFAMALLAFSVGCGDGPTESEEVHIHGVVISDAGTPVVEVDELIVTGAITVAAGDETPDYDFTFMDHDGNPVTSGLADFSLEVTVDDTSVAIFHSTADFQAHFEGLMAGATTFVVALVHTADGDEHFTSPDIDLTVS